MALKDADAGPRMMMMMMMMMIIITHESGKGIQSHNVRTTDIHDKQG